MVDDILENGHGPSGFFHSPRMEGRPATILKYTQDGAKLRQGAIIFDTTAYLINDNGKTIERIQTNPPSFYKGDVRVQPTNE